MVELDLPILPESTRLPEALDFMRNAGRSGLVTEGPRGLILLTADELLDNLREQLKQHQRVTVTLGQLEPRSVGLDVPPGARTPNFVTREVNRRGLDAALASSGAQYAILGAAAGRARVLAVSEAFGDPLMKASVMCKCLKDPTHIWRPVDLTVDGKCKMDNEGVDCK
jgi:hypothetical protein